jgi:hypothetical protein
MPLTTEGYDKLSETERKAYDASEREREKAEQAGALYETVEADPT